VVLPRCNRCPLDATGREETVDGEGRNVSHSCPPLLYRVDGEETVHAEASYLSTPNIISLTPHSSLPPLSSHLLPAFLIHLLVHLLHLAKMQYNGPTYRVPPTVPERLYPAQVRVENTLRVWAISRWRGARELTEFFSPPATATSLGVLR